VRSLAPRAIFMYYIFEAPSNSWRDRELQIAIDCYSASWCCAESWY